MVSFGSQLLAIKYKLLKLPVMQKHYFSVKSLISVTVIYEQLFGNARVISQCFSHRDAKFLHGDGVLSARVLSCCPVLYVKFFLGK